MKIKKWMTTLLAAAMVLGCFAGCGKEKQVEISASPSVSTDATGRYVEKTIPLPEARYCMDMVKLSDGRLRVALEREDGTVVLHTSGADRTTWEEELSLPGEILESGNVESVALAPDGTVFCDTIETLEDETHQPHLWVMDPGGEWREIPVTYPDLDPETGFFIAYCDFTESSRLMAQIYVSDLREINLTTGELGPNLNELEPTIFRSGCGGESAYMMSRETASFHQDGGTKPLPDVLKAQIEGALEEDFGNTPKITFWENKDGYLFFTTCAGLYSYIPGGSVTEELVNGARTSLGDPTCYPVALTGAEDDSFYVLCNLNGEPTLCHFTYDEEAPTVGDTQLRIYSLYEDEDLNQMISQFQKANLDVSVELEIGLTGEDGITEADAIRTLNTEILAGSGPDLVCLDGFDLTSYLEKGVLADVSHILANGDTLLRQITDCYSADGKICAVPTTFTFPAIYGKEEYVSQIHDLDSLVATAKQARADNPDIERIVNGMHPVIMADQFYDSCSAAWMNPDGTLDGEKLAEFYGAMKELYALDEGFREKNAEWMAEVAAEYESGEYFAPGDYTGLSGALEIISDISYLSSGTLDGMYRYAHVLAGEAEYLGDGYITKPLDGQTSNVFLPRRIMGILTTAEHPQAAEKFLSFMLSDEVQAKALSTGFPVNQVTFQRELSEERTIDSWIGSGPDISCQAKWPNAEERQELRGWVDALTTPAQTNRTIRYMVMDQMVDCCNGILTPEEAAQAALQSLNLYLSE